MPSRSVFLSPKGYRGIAPQRVFCDSRRYEPRGESLIMRPYKLLVALFVFLVLAACNSQRPGASERLGHTTQPLLTLGAPCIQNSHCETGFCVDAVCCENSCGGG